MFYSHTFLARKGPLGTVWFAAHLQNKLKKSHYANTDIPSTVERIMCPEVPLALRMSGHLLLGIVRIYSKKVQFLYEDCNAVLNSLRKAFASIDLNLPEDARQAPVQAITLPETFNLDAMDLDDDYNLAGAHDHHLRSHEDITLIDQVPIETELYVSISFDEDRMLGFTHPMEIPHSNMNISEDFVGPSNQNDQQNIRDDDEDTLRNLPGPLLPDDPIHDPSQSNRAEMEWSSHHNESSYDDPTFERQREAELDIPGIPPMIPSPTTDIPESHPSLDQVMNEKDTLPLINEDVLPSGGQTPFQPNSGSQASIASLQEGPMTNNASVSFVIQPTPPAQKQQTRPRKRKQFYDEAPVLTNKFMKKALEDPSNLLRKRKNIPSSALSVWRLKNNLRSEKVFLEPSITGLCSDLCNVFNKDYISSKLQRLEVASLDSGVVRDPAPEFPDPGLPPSPAPAHESSSSPGHRAAEFPTPANNNGQEMENIRHVVDDNRGNDIPGFIPSLSVTPRLREDDVTLSPPEILRSTPSPGKDSGRGDYPTPDFPSQSRLESELDTPDVPQFNNADAEDLFFLEADNNTPTGSQGAKGIDSLSVRTRAVAQFLKRQSPITQISEDPSGDLSLDKLLQGKTRRLCARMFFETLVLKSNGLVDVQQKEPFGDIILNLTPELSKAQI